jgi:hypothetical protein
MNLLPYTTKKISEFTSNYSNDKYNKKFTQLIDRSNITKNGQKILFILLYASSFKTDLYNARNLVAGIFKKYTPHAYLLSRADFDILFDDQILTEENVNLKYFTQKENDMSIKLRQLYQNFNTDQPDKMEDVLAKINQWHTKLTFDSLEQLNNQPMQLLWKLKFGASDQLFDFIIQQYNKIEFYKNEHLKQDNVVSNDTIHKALDLNESLELIALSHNDSFEVL